MLTNRVPIPANYRAEEDVKLSPPQKFNQNISDKVNAAILKGMELEPVNRPQTVREFRELLGLVVKPVVNIPTPPLVNFDIQQPINNVETFHGTSLYTPPNNQEVQLKSSCGMDYRKLRDYLAQEKWKEADEETARVMLAIAKRENEGWLDSESIDNFPCEDLRTIDQLWVKYSDGKFGFSVQKRIYQGLGGTREYNSDIWDKFGDKVGWRKGDNWLYYKDITFDKKAPEGNLPVGQLDNFFCKWERAFFLLFSRVETCRL